MIWGCYYKKNKEKVFREIKERLNHYAQKENIDDIGSSVDRLADVKLGELLETPKSHVGYNVVGNDKRDMLKNNMDWKISSKAS